MNASLLLKGMRPKTLVAGIMPVLGAWALATKNSQPDNMYGILCLMLAVFIQIATNFYNDAVDFKKGADVVRVGPERLATHDKIDYKKVMLIGHIFILFALLVGIPLFIKGGLVFIVLGLFSLFFAYGYTGGPYPLAYLGLGEVFVFLFFGLIATIGSHALITDLVVNTSSVILGVQIGLLSCVLIAINNFRDRHEDKKVGKLTLATKLETKQYLNLINFFLFVPYIFLLYYIFFIDLKFIGNIFSISLAHSIRVELAELTDESYCNVLLAKSAKHLAIFTILFCVISVWE